MNPDRALALALHLLPRLPAGPWKLSSSGLSFDVYDHAERHLGRIRSEAMPDKELQRDLIEFLAASRELLATILANPRIRRELLDTVQPVNPAAVQPEAPRLANIPDVDRGDIE